jgi:hypothetical protein
MDPRLLDALRNAPSLDLYQLSLTAHQMLADPQRILAVRTQLHLGARVTFFHHQTHQLAPGIVVEFRPTEVAVQDETTRKQWWLPYAAIVPDPAAQRAPEPPTPKPAKTPVNFRIGDTVGFTDKYLREHVGTVVRLNDKTVSVDSDGGRWRVSPRLLREIIDL